MLISEKKGNSCITVFVGERDSNSICQYFQVPILWASDG